MNAKYDDENYYENKDQGIDQNLEEEFLEGGINLVCSICGCDLSIKGSNVRYDRRGFIFCMECFSETQ